MKTNFLYIIIFFLMTSCASDDENNEIDCSYIDCFGGAIVQFELLSNSQNILKANPSTKIEINQNNISADFNINTTTNVIALFLSEDNPVTILVDDKQLTMEISSTYITRDCCSGIRIDSITINDALICNGELCSEILQINID